MTPRYLLCPGSVRSRMDGQWRYFGARDLARLYGVAMSDCLVLPRHDEPMLGGGILRAELLAQADRGQLIALWPRTDGHYRLPA